MPRRYQHISIWNSAEEYCGSAKLIIFSLVPSCDHRRSFLRIRRSITLRQKMHFLQIHTPTRRQQKPRWVLRTPPPIGYVWLQAKTL